MAQWWNNNVQYVIEFKTNRKTMNRKNITEQKEISNVFDKLNSKLKERMKNTNK